MKKPILSAAACVGLLGFGSVAWATPATPTLVDTVACNDSKLLCAGNDVYKVSLNCDYLSATTGGLGFFTGPRSFDLYVTDGAGYSCKIEGGIDGFRTEVKCTETSDEPDKKVGFEIEQNPQQVDVKKQVNGEIKYVGENISYCSP
jgi:hypothetical protein